MQNSFEVSQTLSDEYLIKKDCLRNSYKVELPYNVDCEFWYEIGDQFAKDKAKYAADMTANKLYMSGLFD